MHRTLCTLRFLMASDQSGSARATGYRGFYLHFHFLDMDSGTRDAGLGHQTGGDGLYPQTGVKMERLAATSLV